jgi:hypothetical protein
LKNLVQMIGLFFPTPNPKFCYSDSGFLGSFSGVLAAGFGAIVAIWAAILVIA